MGEDELKWFYVGNGQLRAKDAEGWTDQYQDIDGPPKSPDADAPKSPDALEPDSAEAEPEEGERPRSTVSFSTLCSRTAHATIAGLTLVMVCLSRLDATSGRAVAGLWRLSTLRFRKTSPSLGFRPRHGRHRTGPRHGLGNHSREAFRRQESLSRSSR